MTAVEPGRTLRDTWVHGPRRSVWVVTGHRARVEGFTTSVFEHVNKNRTQGDLVYSRTWRDEESASTGHRTVVRIWVDSIRETEEGT